MNAPNLQIAIILLVGALSAGVLTTQAHAAKGHCTYELYSVWLDRSLKVRQAADSPTECGEWPMTEHRYKSMARASKDLVFVEGDCSQDAIVGMCALPASTLFFYEGDASDLAAGCRRMKGEWLVKRRTR